MSNIGFIGLGNMGAPMAANLVKSGERVLGFDVVEAPRRASAGDGVQIVATARGCVENADVVISMLPGGEQVLSVWKMSCRLRIKGRFSSIVRPLTWRAHGKRTHSRPRAASPRSMLRSRAGSAERRPPRSPSWLAARRKPSSAASRCSNEWANASSHCGEAGNGQVAKICNNMILGISMIGVSEAFVLGERLGLSHQALFDVASASSGQCWSLTSYCPVPGPVPASPANNGYKPGFAAALMLKDLKLAREAAASVKAMTALGVHAARDLRPLRSTRSRHI